MSGMNGKTLSVTLEPGNLIWLKARASGHRSMSEVLNEVVLEARTSPRVKKGSIRPIKGTIEISEDDPNLERADEAIRVLFDDSLAKTARSLRSPSG